MKKEPQPNSDLILEPALDARPAILRLVKDEVGVGLRLLLHGFVSLRFELFDNTE